MDNGPRSTIRSDAAPHILYLNFDGGTLHGGNCNSSPNNCSFIVATSSYDFPPYVETSRATKAAILAKVQEFYRDFNVQVVTTRPPVAPYSMTMVGPGSAVSGTPGAAGVAPLDCGDGNQNDLSFAFTDVVSSIHEISTTIAQESAHGYGLGHTNNPQDIQYPALSGQEIAFLDMNMRICDIVQGFPANCGTQSDCTGTGMQNSHGLLLQNLGPGAPPGPDVTPPSSSFVKPTDGMTVPSGFTIEFNASDDHGVVAMDLLVDGSKIGGVDHAPWTFTIPMGFLTPGVHKLKGTARDAANNSANSNEISVTVLAIGESPGDLGSTCNKDTDCPGGSCAFDSGAMRHFCTRVCDTGANACPNGFACVNAGGPMVCAPSTSTGMGGKGGGCAVSGLGGASSLAGAMLLGLGLLALVLARGRRSR